MTTTNADLASRAQQVAKGSDSLQRTAASMAALALSRTENVADARGMLAELLRPDLRAAAMDLIGRLGGGERHCLG